MRKKELFMLIDILKIDASINNPLNIGKLAKNLNISGGDTIFQKVKRDLIRLSIFKVLDNKYKDKAIINIDKKKLSEYIPECDIVRKIHDEVIVKWAKKKVWKYE